MAKAPLSPAAWIEAGLDQLTAVGPMALRAEPLSRYLKTSKGSFYWHFKDVPAFQAAILAHWKDHAMAELKAEAAMDGTPTDKMIRFGQNVQNDTAGPALRAWAHADAAVKAAVRDVDSARMTRLVALMSDIGVTNDDFTKAAYGALVGLKQMNSDDGEALVAFAALVDLVMALK
ncbi:TetR/AcrR family transcriptional regulator [uncultured Tateyamaria sp.]|uniref:TetR/AcrR family transcriptional regulator n=1 Tax=uncultured Tateyamaria sp. TaxID=455651 RepID=UPI002639041C|nr:TetR/AcrR family transcriptional regulator [uncultured Tateyamaria sp.]